MYYMCSINVKSQSQTNSRGWCVREFCKTQFALGVQKMNEFFFLQYRKFPNRGAGRLGKTLRGAIIRERTFSTSSGFLQNENRTIFGWDMAKNVQKPRMPWVKRGGRLYRRWRLYWRIYGIYIPDPNECPWYSISWAHRTLRKQGKQAEQSPL